MHHTLPAFGAVLYFSRNIENKLDPTESDFINKQTDLRAQSDLGRTPQLGQPEVLGISCVIPLLNAGKPSRDFPSQPSRLSAIPIVAEYPTKDQAPSHSHNEKK